MKTNKKNNNKKKKSHIPFRLNFLFFTVFLLFAMLILRLGYLQIVKGEEFETEVQRTETTLATGTVPRGEIYDRQHRKLVGNEALQAITYTRGTGVSGEDMAKIALNLAKYIEMPNITEFEQDSDFDLSKRDLKDFWISLNEEKVNKRISDKQKESLSGSELYQVQVDKVTDEDIQFTEEEQEAAAIFKRMNSAYALSTINIKSEDVTNDEIAKVSENLLTLPGVDTGTDWVRTYPEENMLKSILGDVTSESEGLPENKAATYLAQGYARNDRVGKSYLELQYEEVLSGSKSKSETETNQNGDIVNTIQSYAGEKGDNLVLTTDMDFQKIVQDIAKQSLATESEGLNDSIYVVAADPNNGEILAMTGQKRNSKTGKIEDHTLDIINSSFQMGSVVKPATVLAGYMDGAITLSDNTLIDEPLLLKGSNPISSVFNRSGSIALNDITALERSSNVYMSKIALRMGGEYDYYKNMSLNIDYKAVIKKMRNYYAQFGLGVKTGIDLPGEGSGFLGTADNPGLALQFSFGQYDTYTPIQMLQYVSTIANGGKRIAPRLVDEIRGTDADGNLGAIQTQLETEVLNIVDVGEEEMDRVHQGMYQVANGANGSATSYFTGAEYTIAGKTGTAEAPYYGDITSRIGELTTNRTFVGYAPYDDPEIAIFVIIPYLPNTNSNHENTIVARKVLDAYFQVGDYADLSKEIADENESDTE
ncbi:MAG: penicillin-binding protein [Carnobacterium sp.]|uniref:peptidoglycan D,D-transpeptidase FtsI family protein n=1 Tax=Carnobacterium TaxID=2747 RepID=UPI00203F33CC|nr:MULTISPECIES: penicillin-binding protein 2 [Carnobacterium]MCM3512358.1 penicillin-binding protein 2 [Carnobacterium inhibens]MDN5372852.1 penicillin-binding protein [Carnobacterium sp.]